MELIRGLHNIQAQHHGCVATIGNFDGVHRGHQAILEQIRSLGRSQSLPTLLITFEPYPREFFAPGNAPTRLTRFREKVCELSNHTLDRVLLLRFGEALSSMNPTAFVEELLLEKLGVRALVVGEDFRFGQRAEGNFDFLSSCGERLGFEVHCQETYLLQGVRVSSSRVRDALSEGDLTAAAELLGRPYSVLGKVAPGRQLGRTIGFPTANIQLRRISTPLSGVFAVRAHGLAERPLAAMANLGTRPTVDGTQLLLEVHIFDFSEDIYGRELRIEFVQKLRDEVKFDGIDALKAQLAKDMVAARQALA